jgi:hypothetical protein
MQTTPQPLSDLEWLEMANRMFWSRVYTLKAQTGCTLEMAILAIRDADRQHNPTAK